MPIAALEGRVVDLVAPSRRDDEWIADFVRHPEINSRWRLGAGVHGTDAAIRVLDRDSLVQFVVRDRASGDRCGLVQAIHPDFLNRVVSLGLALDRRWRNGFAAVDALIVTLDYLFDNWQFRKVYFTVPSDLMPQFGATVDRWTDREGVLEAREFRRGSFVDLHLLSISRARWDEVRAMRARRRGRVDAVS